MIRPGFLDSESRRDLIELARDGSAAHRLARRANALVLLDKGMSCQSIAEVLLLDGDTIRTWYQLYQEDGIEGLASFGHEGGSCRLTVEQQDQLKAWIAATLPRSTRAVGSNSHFDFLSVGGFISSLMAQRAGSGRGGAHGGIGGGLAKASVRSRSSQDGKIR